MAITFDGSMLNERKTYGNTRFWYSMCLLHGNGISLHHDGHQDTGSICSVCISAKMQSNASACLKCNNEIPGMEFSNRLLKCEGRIRNATQSAQWAI